MAELKTKPNDASATQFLNGIPDQQRLDDAFMVLQLMQKATKAQPVMWGSSIIGFGHYQYAYPSGRVGEWFVIGFSPRKQNLVLYPASCSWAHCPALPNLGRYTFGKGCLYIKRLADVDLPTLKQVIKQVLKQRESSSRERAQKRKLA